MDLQLSLSATAHIRSVSLACADDIEGTSACDEVRAAGSLPGAGLSGDASSAAEGVVQARETYSQRLVSHGGAVAEAAEMLMRADEEVAQGAGG